MYRNNKLFRFTSSYVHKEIFGSGESSLTDSEAQLGELRMVTVNDSKNSNYLIISDKKKYIFNSSMLSTKQVLICCCSY